MGRLTIARYYSGTAIVLHGLVAVLLAVSGAVEPGFLVLVIVLGALFAALRVGRGLQRLLGVLVVGAGIVVGILAFQRARDILYLFTHPLLSLLPLFLPSLREPGRYWRALLVSFLLAVVSLISGAELSEYALFFFYCLVLIFHMNAAFLFQSVGRVDAERMPLPERYFPPFLTSVAGGTLFAIVLFVLFPRSIQWTNPLGLRSRETVTGYTGEVALEGASPRESSALALTIESSDVRWLSRVGPWLFIRGNTLDKFDGTRWWNSFAHSKPLLHPKSLRYTEFVDKVPHEVRLFREIHLPQTVVYPGVLVAIVAPNQLLKGLREDGAGNLTRGAIGPMRYSYQTTILLPRHDVAPAAKLSEYRHPKLEKADAYRQLPSGLAEASYFQRWMNEVGAPTGADVPVSAVLGALERNFRSRFTAIDRNERTEENSLERFLGESRVGHCEYFASAATLFLRARGIPARLALGYRGGQFNTVSGVLEIRESNAHAWVEVFVPGEGWRTFDPTPIGISLAMVTVWEHAKSYLSAARFWFDRYLVDYNSQTQKELFRDLATIRKPAAGEGFGFGSRRVLVGIALIGALWFLRRRWRWRKGRRFRTKSGLPGYYVTFQRKMKRRGLVRRFDETYAVFHARLLKAKQPHELVAMVDEGLDRDLYAEEPMSDRERREITKRVRELQ